MRGYSGFGFAALVVISASLVTDPLPVVAVVTLCDFALTFQQWRGIRRDIDWRRVLGLLAGGLPGVPLGVFLLARAGGDTVRVLISLFVLAMCGLLLAGWSLKRPVGGAGHSAIGLASGMANAAGVGGLPVAVFLAAQSVGAAAFRATLIAYFALLDIWTMGSLWGQGRLDAESLVATALALPLVVLGSWAGGRHFLSTAPQDFRRFAIALLAVLALLGLARSLL